MLNDNNEPQEVNFKELVQGKKVVIFGLPGGSWTQYFSKS
jgi:peroxiredoxin